jgi:hypothetical protein
MGKTVTILLGTIATGGVIIAAGCEMFVAFPAASCILIVLGIAAVLDLRG